MKITTCEKCGSGDFVDRDGYRICQYCGTKYLITDEDVPRKRSSIALDNDITMLLQKCRDDPVNASRYASLVLDMDPGNTEAVKYLRRR